MRELGQFYRMGADVAVGLFRTRFQVQEFLEQSWMIARVSIVPTVLVAVPFTVLVSFTLNILLREIGAADLSGAGAALGAVTQVGPVVTVLIVAGAGATAIAADLGSRTIREEIDAMEVLGIDPITRLVIPRVVASTVVALLLNGLVCVIGIAGGYAFSVFLQGVNLRLRRGNHVADRPARGGVVDGQSCTVRDAGGIGGLLSRTVGTGWAERRGGGRQRNGGVRIHGVVRRQHHRHRGRHPIDGGVIEVTLSDSLAQIGKFGRTRARVARTSRSIDDVGRQAVFFARAIAHIPWAIRKHPKEVLRLVAEISMGTGALAVIGGTVAVVGFLTLASGGTIAIQGFSSLGNIGVEALTGFFSAFINVRIAAPVIAGIGLSATIGAGSTAQIGAMRISEEIDALESMAISSVPYVVSTRVTAGMIAILPLYSLALVGSFLAGRFTTVVLFGQSSGLYDHYFTTFLDPVDVAWSFVQVLVMALLVMLIHTYYGYNASGGPSGVGTAVGRGVRLSLICVVAVTLLVSLALYGGSGNFNLSG